jgi:ABC-type polar amino acid transport system ATPase subunit
VDVATLQKDIEVASNQYNRLVIIVGPPGSGKSRLLRQLEDSEFINLSQELAKALLPKPQEDRALYVNEALWDIVSLRSKQVLALDNIELLFHPELRTNPLGAFERLSRNRTLVVAWTGSYDGRQLSWADLTADNR